MNDLRPIPLLSISALLLALALNTAAAEDAHAGHDHGAGAHTAEAHAEEAEPAVVLTEEAMKRHGVAVAKAERSAVLGQPVIAPATVTFDPDRIAHVASVVAGRIAKLHVRQGAQVAIGDPLVDIDSQELGRAQSEYLQKLAAVAIAQASATIAEQSYQRAQNLVNENALPPAEAQRREGELLRARTGVMAAEADRQAAENALTLLGVDAPAREQLAKTGIVNPRLTLRAPMAGTVTERTATVGQSVTPDTERLLTIADPSALWILANVPESAAGQISVGAVAVVTGPALGNQSLKTTVAAIASTVDAKTRSVQVRLEVAGGNGLRPGAFVQVEILPAAKRSQVVVPRSAVFAVNSSPTVFVPEGSANRFVARTVETGDEAGDQIVIIEGLAEGESVVVAGGFLIKADLGKMGAKGCCDPH